jgi:hypothetical protein
MTRNNERASQVRDAIGPPGTTQEQYQLAAWAKRYAAIMAGPPLLWAQSVHTMMTSGQMRPRNEPCDAEKIGSGLDPARRAQAQRAVCRGENELRLRTMIRAIRMLSASKDASDNKQARALEQFLESVWGIRRAYEVLSEGDAEVYDRLREEWGEVPLPPAGATVGTWSADEALIRVTVRRVS